MVAQQILVLFVLVRIQVEQPKKASLFDKGSEAFWVSSFIYLFVAEPFYHFLDARLLTVHQDTYPVYLGGKPREADRTDVKQSDGEYDFP